MSNPSVLLLGARSDIAIAIAHRFAREGYNILLASRKSKKLEIDRVDIELRYGVIVTIHEFDALSTSTHETFLNSLPNIPNIAVCAVGRMGTQSDSQKNIETAIKVLRTNFEGPLSIIGHIANQFENVGSGTIVGISSVAGERGRAKNYIYGSAKAGFTIFLSGLRNRLSQKGVHVLTVLPGFVFTKMTVGLNLPVKLTAQPKDVADAIFCAVQKKKNIIYVYPIWSIIMLIIRNIPECLFKNMKI